jgi:hypothetical protein
MKTKAYRSALLATCAILSAPVSAGATTFTLSNVTYDCGLSFCFAGTGTFTGTFDYNAGVFSPIDIVATGGFSSSPNTITLDTNTNNSSTASDLEFTNSGNSAEFLSLFLAAPLPTSPDSVIGGGLGGFVSNCAIGAICSNEFPVSGSFVSAVPLSAVPLPAALPLFASGLGALGLLGWRRKRKAQAAI